MAIQDYGLFCGKCVNSGLWICEHIPFTLYITTIQSITRHIQSNVSVISTDTVWRPTTFTRGRVSLSTTTETTQRWRRERCLLLRRLDPQVQYDWSILFNNILYYRTMDILKSCCQISMVLVSICLLFVVSICLLRKGTCSRRPGVLSLHEEFRDWPHSIAPHQIQATATLYQPEFRYVSFLSPLVRSNRTREVSPRPQEPV